MVAAAGLLLLAAARTADVQHHLMTQINLLRKRLRDNAACKPRGCCRDLENQRIRKQINLLREQAREALTMAARGM